MNQYGEGDHGISTERHADQHRHAAHPGLLLQPQA